MSKSTQIATLGDDSILDLPKVGFLSSRKVPPAAVMKCYDWATEMRDQGVCVMGGFQSPLERDALTFLLQGKQPAIWCWRSITAFAWHPELTPERSVTAC